MTDPDAFLRQEIESASPARLRWLLLRRAIGLCRAVDELWREGDKPRADQWLLRVRDIFAELLDGITDRANPAAQPLSDLYVYLMQLSLEAELSQDSATLATLVEILEIELMTWELFLRQEQSRHASPASAEGSFNTTA